ncbi:MAG: YraN family protein [Alphaproteobacteria bacterium]|nr:MAG: YraN family protein [Alphaproteobacteria bacterium]
MAKPNKSPFKVKQGGDNFRRGVWAESCALLFLLSKGYWPLARRYKTRDGEIDLIVRRGRTVAFVEIKSRGDIWAASEANSHYHRKRIAAAADIFLKNHPGYWNNYHLRYDEVICVPGKWPVHIISAWS